MTSTNTPCGWGWDNDKRLISAISLANPVLGRYVLRLVDVDAGIALDWSLDAERELGQQVNAIANQILQRAEAREQGTLEQPGLLRLAPHVDDSGEST